MFLAHTYSFYLLGCGAGALVSCVVGCSPQIHFLGGHSSLPRRCRLRRLDNLNALGCNSLLFVFKLLL